MSPQERPKSISEFDDTTVITGNVARCREASNPRPAIGVHCQRKKGFSGHNDSELTALIKQIRLRYWSTK